MTHPTRSIALACVVWLACHGLPAFEALTPDGAAVRESDGSDVASCRYLGDFSENLSSGGGIDAIRRHLRNQAAASGATVIVWDDIPSHKPTDSASGRMYRDEVVGRAYACP